MAHVPVVPIGKTREAVVDQATYDRELAGHEPLASRLDERRAEVHAGWGDKYADRVHEKDKLTTRERLDRLRDDGSEIFEVGTFVNYGLDFNGLRSPAAGVVTAFVQIEGRWCVVIANDNTVASGAWNVNFVVSAQPPPAFAARCSVFSVGLPQPRASGLQQEQSRISRSALPP